MTAIVDVFQPRYGIGSPQFVAPFDELEELSSEDSDEGVCGSTVTMESDDLEETDDGVDRLRELSVLEERLDSVRKLMELSVTLLRDIELSDFDDMVLAVAVVRDDRDTDEALTGELSELKVLLERALDVEFSATVLFEERLEVDQAARVLRDEKVSEMLEVEKRKNVEELLLVLADDRELTSVCVDAVTEVVSLDTDERDDRDTDEALRTDLEDRDEGLWLLTLRVLSEELDAVPWVDIDLVETDDVETSELPVDSVLRVERELDGDEELLVLLVLQVDSERLFVELELEA